MRCVYIYTYIYVCNLSFRLTCEEELQGIGCAMHSQVHSIESNAFHVSAALKAMETSTAWPWALQVLKELPVLHVAPNDAWLAKGCKPSWNVVRNKNNRKGWKSWTIFRPKMPWQDFKSLNHWSFTFENVKSWSLFFLWIFQGVQL